MILGYYTTPLVHSGDATSLVCGGDAMPLIHSSDATLLLHNDEGSIAVRAQTCLGLYSGSCSFVRQIVRWNHTAKDCTLIVFGSR